MVDVPLYLTSFMYRCYRSWRAHEMSDHNQKTPLCPCCRLPVHASWIGSLSLWVRKGPTFWVPSDPVLCFLLQDSVVQCTACCFSCKMGALDVRVFFVTEEHSSLNTNRVVCHYFWSRLFFFSKNRVHWINSVRIIIPQKQVRRVFFASPSVVFRSHMW